MSSKYPICNVWYDWRTETDKNMQKTFCVVAQATDTDAVGTRRGWNVKEEYCGSCNRNINNKQLWNEIKYKKY